MSAVYSVYTNRAHQAAPKHLPTISITPHGQPHHVLYNFVHTQLNTENYLLTPSKKGDLCVAKLSVGKDNRTVNCEASRSLKWFISNAGVMNPVYKVSLPNPSADGDDLPLFQISKPNPNANFWSLFYFVFGGYQIPPKRVEFGRVMKSSSKDKPSEIKITITGKTSEEKAVWQTLGEGNEDAVEWVVLCTILNLLDDQIKKSPSEIPIMQPQPQSKTPSQNRKPAQASSYIGAQGASGSSGHHQPRPAAPVVAPASQQSRITGQRPPQLAPLPNLGFLSGPMPMPMPVSQHPQNGGNKPHMMPQQGMPPRIPSSEFDSSLTSKPNK